MFTSGPKKKHKDINMKTLSEAIANFHPRVRKAEDIEVQFEEIAMAAIYGGYFLVNGKKRIYLTDIEFYLYGEKATDPEWMKDFNMYHKGKNVPYFPKEGSLYPHRSGVDYTFENEEEEYRASFLIRGYRTSYDGKTESHPTYLWEDMFGECTCADGGIKIEWVNDPSDERLGVRLEDRVRLNRRDGSKDTKPWRFIKNEK